MSGFDKDWLALREPVDASARDADLLSAAADSIAASAKPSVLDIGCGTGSTFRVMGSALGPNVTWRMADHDEALLKEAKRRHDGIPQVEFVSCDLNDLEALPISDVGMVTASALFDLCSAQFTERFKERLAPLRVGLYAALNYDGHMAWSQVHSFDDTVVRAFNAHQLTDKGFGPSLGPGAWEHLANVFRGAGYRVLIAQSPWVMTGEHDNLQRAFLQGLAQAVAERGLDAARISAWMEFRLKAIAIDGSSCRVGHRDVLALG